MKKEDYKQINNYFNDLAVRVFDSKNFEDYFFLYTILNDMYVQYYDKRYHEDGMYNITVNSSNMTFEDVFNLSREIIENINPKYTIEFDELLDKGLLDFSYEHEYSDSHVSHEYEYGVLKRRYININRAFNYTDFEVLIHEFMHYLTTTGNKIKNKVIGELISIYYELYALEYLYKNHDVKMDEFFYNKRLVNVYIYASKVRCTEVPLLIYKSFGDLNEKSYEDGKYYFKNYTKENYDYECGKVLEVIDMIKEDHNKCYELDEALFYTVATYLAFYFRKKSNSKTFLNFLENVTDKSNEDLDILELLEKYNLKVEDDIFQILPESLDEYLDIFENREKQR